MKKLIAILLLAALALSVVACGTTTPTGDTTDTTTAAPEETTAAPLPTDTITGDLVEIVRGFGDGVLEIMVEPMAVDAESSEWLAGITADDYAKYVESLAICMPMMMAQAHHEIIVKCKDAESALAIKDAIEKGFDPGRWVCVQAEKIICGISGTHVYMVASSADWADKLFAKFEALSGELPVQKFEFDTTPFIARG